MWSLNGLFDVLVQKKKRFIVAGNHEHKETESINSLQSSPKSHRLRIALYTIVFKEKTRIREA